MTLLELTKIAYVAVSDITFISSLISSGSRPQEIGDLQIKEIYNECFYELSELDSMTMKIIIEVLLINHDLEGMEELDFA